jgi:hypothetical protein
MKDNDRGFWWIILAPWALFFGVLVWPPVVAIVGLGAAVWAVRKFGKPALVVLGLLVGVVLLGVLSDGRGGSGRHYEEPFRRR